jgi:tetratricopeptide (TPR) repeat protein
MRVWLLLGCAILALVAGCSSAPPSKSSVAARQAAALEANRKGEAYVRHGELDSAARSYAEAMRLSQSLEDPDGIAANAINLSIVRQRQGRFADARASLALISGERFAAPRLAEVALRHALLDMDEHRFASAGQWVEKASGHCAARCAAAGAIHNVRAQLALQSGQTEAAIAAARAAHDASRSAGDRAEQANALRLLGISALRSGDAAAARAHLEQALAHDREIGAPRKIALDLLALGRAAALGGEHDTARAYYARALAVSEADRDGASAAEARALLDGIGKAATGK